MSKTVLCWKKIFSENFSLLEVMEKQTYSCEEILVSSCLEAVISFVAMCRS